jgi:vanillate O-demethylase monooxygenase subunit
MNLTETAHYFWTIAPNPENDIEEIKEKVVEQNRFTFDEDKVVVEEQFKNMKKFGEQPTFDIYVDIGPNSAQRLLKNY